MNVEYSSLLNTEESKFSLRIPGNPEKNANRGMFKAAKAGNIELIKYYISQGADSWNTGLYYAAQSGNREIIDFLIGMGATDRNAGLSGAARAGLEAMIYYFIGMGANDWNLALYSAAKGGHMTSVEFFVAKAHSGNILKNELYSPPDYNRGMLGAAYGGHTTLVKYFIDRGADDWVGGMHFATWGGHTALVEFFTSKEIYYWEYGLLNSARFGNKTFVQFFIDKGAKLLNWGLHGAVQGGHIGLMQMLINKGADDFDGALYYAAENGHIHIIKYILGKKIFPNYTDKININRALLGAIKNGNKEIVEIFLNLEDVYIDTDAAVEYAFSLGKSELFELLGLDNDFLNINMLRAIKAGDVPSVEYCIAQGACAWCQGLLMAVRFNNEGLTRFFIDMGATDFNRALLIAAGEGHTELVQILLAEGACNQDALDGALYQAIECGHSHLVNYFIELGANKWDVALKAAVEYGKKEFIDLFINKGATNIREMEYRARRCEQYEIADLLRNRLDPVSA